LTDAERSELQAHEARLAEALTPFVPSEETRVRASLAAMFSGFRSMRQEHDDALDVVRITTTILREFPAWAIAQGCLAVIQGKTKLDRRFAPNDSEIYDVVAEVVRYGRKRLEITRAMLAARSTERPAKPAMREYAPTGLPRITAWRKSPPPAIPPERLERLRADLAARKARNEALRTGSTGGQP